MRRKKAELKDRKKQESVSDYDEDSEVCNMGWCNTWLFQERRIGGFPVTFFAQCMASFEGGNGPPTQISLIHPHEDKQ